MRGRPGIRWVCWAASPLLSSVLVGRAEGRVPTLDVAALVVRLSAGWEVRPWGVREAPVGIGAAAAEVTAFSPEAAGFGAGPGVLPVPGVGSLGCESEN